MPLDPLKGTAFGCPYLKVEIPFSKIQYCLSCSMELHVIAMFAFSMQVFQVKMVGN